MILCTVLSGNPSDAGRSLSLLDPTYASKYIPIIASVSEHQPPAWPSYFTDLHVASVLMPAGLIALFWPLTAASMFLILYACTAVYFSGVMVRAPYASLAICSWKTCFTQQGRSAVQLLKVMGGGLPTQWTPTPPA